ncbi:hypothetical protein [Rhodopirellula sallentina]|uniref:Secreted protein n=1 Tax=Rhodopirellula sallentina SM41 TaxID=1263870 RepID=M5U7Q3_9BACT|nr:hypothetical protein [Rhodopirellula sallentina]EMI57294.1 secreted protein [Rhodopirellula sallentina SM41]
MKVTAHLLVLALVVTSIGCAEEKPERAYDISDVEQLLIDHPELAEPPPPEYRVED